MQKTAFLFPGQGSQTVGMGQALAASSPQARARLTMIDEALGESLEYHAHIVIQKSIQRQLITVAGEIGTKAFE